MISSKKTTQYYGKFLIHRVTFSVMTKTNSVVGSCVIHIFSTNTRVYAKLNDVQVNEMYRRNGFGTQLLKGVDAYLSSYARYTDHVVSLRFTSELQKFVANKLYVKLGFTTIARIVGNGGINYYGKEYLP